MGDSVLSQSAPSMESLGDSWSHCSSSLSAGIDHPLSSAPNLCAQTSAESLADSNGLGSNLTTNQLHPAHSDPLLHIRDDSADDGISFPHKRSSVSPNMEILSREINGDDGLASSMGSEGFESGAGCFVDGVSLSLDENSADESCPLLQNTSNNNRKSVSEEGKENRIKEKRTPEKNSEGMRNGRHSSGENGRKSLPKQNKTGSLSNTELENGSKVNGSSLSGSPSGVYFSNVSSPSKSSANGSVEIASSLVFTYSKAGESVKITESYAASAPAPAPVPANTVEGEEFQRSTSHQSGLSELSSSTEEMKVGGSSLESSLSASEVGNLTRRGSTRGSTRSFKKKTTSWYSLVGDVLDLLPDALHDVTSKVLSSNYKSRHEEFKRIFKDVPKSQRLIVDYACALQRNILVQGRMYISQHWVCFYANIFGVETSMVIQFKDIIQITKEKTARVFSNAIQISTKDEKYFITSLNFRDKTYLILSNLWQNCMQEQVMDEREMWNMIHYCYGEELGLDTEDDDDYVELSVEDKSQYKEKIEAVASLVQCTESIGLSDPAKDNVVLEDKAEDDDEGILSAAVAQCNNNAANTVTVSSSSASVSECSTSGVNHCNEHEHYEIEALNEVLNCSVDDLFKHCLTDSKVYKRFSVEKPLLNVVSEPWPEVAGADGTFVRNLSYTLRLNNAMGPKTAATTEKQVMHAVSQRGEFYLVDTECNSPGLPYGENFYVTNRYCITRVTDSTARLRITSCIKYRKSVWSFVKSLIDKNGTAGVIESFSVFGGILRDEVNGGREVAQGVSSEEASAGDAKLRHRRAESKSGIKSHGRDVKSTGWLSGLNVFSDQTSTIISRITALMFLVLVLCNVFLIHRLWSDSGVTSTSSIIDNISMRNGVLDESHTAESVGQMSADRFAAIQQQLSVQQAELDRIRAVLLTLETSVSEIKDSMSTILKSVKEK